MLQNGRSAIHSTTFCTTHPVHVLGVIGVPHVEVVHGLGVVLPPDLGPDVDVLGVVGGAGLGVVHQLHEVAEAVGPVAEEDGVDPEVGPEVEAVPERRAVLLGLHGQGDVGLQLAAAQAGHCVGN